MLNAGLSEAEAGIKTARRNINNLRYADDTTLMTKSEEELKSLLMKVKKESEKAGLKPNIQKTKIMASGPITSWQKDGETMDWFKTGKMETVETVTGFIFLGSQITVDCDCRHKIKKYLLLGRKEQGGGETGIPQRLNLPPGLDVALTVKNLPAMQETWVQSLDREDPLEKGMATYSSILGWRIPWAEEPDRL